MTILINQPGREFDECQEDIERELIAVARSGRWLFGPQTEAFIAEFGAYVGVEHVMPVANGTDALELALRGVGVAAGDEVIAAPNAGFYTSAMLIEIGAIPVYADIEQPAMTLDFDAALAAITDKTRAVVVTHLYGNLADIPALRAMLDAAGRKDIAIIEDCAQAHGAQLADGRQAGSLGDAATFSFYPTKNLAALGDAGAVTTQHDAVAARIRQLQQYGWGERYHVGISHGRNSRMDEMQAAILRIKLRRLTSWNDRRRDILQAYRQALPSGYMLCALQGGRAVGHLAVITCPDRDAAAAALQDAGIGTAVHFPILDCDQAAIQALPHRASSLPVARKVTSQILTLPCFPGLTDAELGQVCAALSRLPRGVVDMAAGDA